MAEICTLENVHSFNYRLAGLKAFENRFQQEHGLAHTDIGRGGSVTVESTS